MFNTEAEQSARKSAQPRSKPASPFPFSTDSCARILMRRLSDVVVASAILLFTLPLLVVVGFAVKYESPGPVFERTLRIVSGHRFTLLTFRTTAHDPEFFAPEWARTITQVGRFLRYTQIDTLPQLINVLRGELSLFDGAGPRSFFLD